MRSLRPNLFLSVVVVTLGASTPAIASPFPEELPSDRAAWWIQHRGLIDEEQEPRVERAHRVFERVAAAADKRASRLPRLLPVRGAGNPFAIALPDGSVVLTEGGLNICYEGVAENIGDARLAFVLGHELAHLGNDDFWHATAFDAFRAHGAADETGAVIADLLEQENRDARRMEVSADGYGILYMAIAGYDPRSLFREKSFFRDWVEEMELLGVRLGKTHPTPEERAAFVQSQLTDTADEVEFFYFGVRLFQVGRYADAILLLERFRDRFPSREVLNNIGLSHYQLAAEALGSCDGSLVVRFKLPTVLDSQTRARRLRGAPVAASPCFESELFRYHYDEGLRSFNEASERDLNYIPARINKLSLLALAQKGAQAYVAAQDAARISPDDPRVLYGQAVALYLFGEQSGTETADTAIDDLQRLHREYPESPHIAYNLAALLAERRRIESARTLYEAYLRIEPYGLHANAARDFVDLDTNTHAVRRGPFETPEARVRLGPLDLEALRERFGDLEFQEVATGDFRGSVVRGEFFKAYAIDSVIEMIEQKVTDPMTATQSLARYGDPIERIGTPNGHFADYYGFGLEIDDGLVRSVLLYSELATPGPNR